MNLSTIYNDPRGVYKITNSLDGHTYVGSSTGLYRRWRRHLNLLRLGKHHSIRLQRAYDRDGEENFTFEILETTEELAQRELHWMTELRPEYNMTKKAYSREGCFHSEASIQKMREAHTGKHFSTEHKQKLSQSHKGKSNPWASTAHMNNDECRKKTKETRGKTPHKPRVVSDETRMKLSLALKGRPKSEESKQKCRETIAKKRQQNESDIR